MTNSGTCAVCKKEVKLTKDGFIRNHGKMRSPCLGRGHAPLELNNGFDSAVSLLAQHRGITQELINSNRSSSYYQLDTYTIKKCVERIEEGKKAGFTSKDVKKFGGDWARKYAKRVLELIPELVETAQETAQETVQALTELETQLLNGLTEDSEEYLDGTIEYRACNESSLHNLIDAPRKSISGVVASLLKKGLIFIDFVDDVPCGRGFKEEKFYSISEKGLKALEPQETAQETAQEEVQETAQEEVQETAQEEVQETAQETAVQALTEMQCVQMSAQDLFETASNCLKVLAGILKQNDKTLASASIKEAMITVDNVHTDLIFANEPVLLDELFVKMYNFEEKRFYTVEETQAKAREAVQAEEETPVQAKEETPEEEETPVQDYIQKAEALRVARIDAKIKEIADLTDSNDHSGVVCVLADLVECGSSSDRALALYILKEHRKLGHMPHNLRSLRYELRERLLDKASQVLSNDQYQALRQAL